MVISGPMRLVESISPWDAKEHGPLPLFLLVLTFITGLVDALSYLKLGHVFVANMTGNVVFLGFAVANAQDFSIPASVVAIGAFLVGALAGGRLGTIAGSVGSIGRWCRPIPWYEPRCRCAARAGSSTDTIVQWIRRRPSGVMSGWQSTRAAHAARPDAGA
jgi:hypothetical protein